MQKLKTTRSPSVSVASAGAGGVIVGHKPACPTARSARHIVRAYDRARAAAMKKRAASRRV